MQSPTIATYPLVGGRARLKGAFSNKGQREGAVTNVYWRKTLEKPKRGLQILRIKVWEFITCEEGISTPTHPSQGTTAFNQMCKFMTSIFIYFPFFMFFYLFRVDKTVTFAPAYPRVRWGTQTYVVLKKAKWPFCGANKCLICELILALDSLGYLSTL